MSAEPVSAPPSPSPTAPPAPDAAGAVQAEAQRSWHQATVTYLGRFLRALVDDETYDVRRNPTLWVGFLMALPIPILTWAGQAPPWLLTLSVPAPLFWGVIVGAAGRAGVQTELAARRLQAEISKTRTAAKAAIESVEEALDEEVHKREELEHREELAISELKLAEAVHRTLIPENVERPDVEVCVRQIPSAYIGGDYLYAAVAADRWLYLIVGDVAGHGVSAALVVARIHGLVRRLTLALRARPITILQEINDATLEIFRHTYFFMTLGVYRLDLQTGLLRYATAGHPEQVLLRRDGTLETLRTPNRLLGMDPDIFDAHHPAAKVQLEEGDTLVLFTDGLFEILSDEDGEVLGEQGLHDRIESLAGFAPQLLAGEVLQELADFQGRSTFEDDVSLMVATYRGRQEDHAAGAGI